MASSEKFVPLNVGQTLPGGTGGFRAGIISTTATPARPAFQPLMAAAPVLAPSPHVHAPAEAVRPPVVTLKREGDRVVGIHIECSCGQIIDLACS